MPVGAQNIVVADFRIDETDLTAITDEADFARLHLLDSAALLGVEAFAGRRVVDVGTGAGFPGVPLRILCPDVKMTLLDSTAKRVDFLREIRDGGEESEPSEDAGEVSQDELPLNPCMQG